MRKKRDWLIHWLLMLFYSFLVFENLIYKFPFVVSSFRVEITSYGESVTLIQMRESLDRQQTL
jgi:hypothetical protein